MGSQTDNNDVWIGGFMDVQGVWKWIDGNPWSFSNSMLGDDSRLGCAYLNANQVMAPLTCRKKRYPLCQSVPEIRKTSFQKHWNLTKKDFQLPLKLEIVFASAINLHPTGQTLGRNQTGFSVEWYVEKEESGTNSALMNDSQARWTQDLLVNPKYLKLNEYLVKMVNTIEGKEQPLELDIMKAVKDRTMFTSLYESNVICKHCQRHYGPRR